MVPPREIEYSNHCDYLITEDDISDIDDNLSGVWIQNVTNDTEDRKQRRKSKKAKSNCQRHRQERRLSLSNCVDTTLNDCKGTTSDTPPSIPKQRSDFILSSSSYDIVVMKNADYDNNNNNNNSNNNNNNNNNNNDDDDGTGTSGPLSSSLEVSEHSKINIGCTSSTKTIDSPPFVPQRKNSMRRSCSIDNSLMATLSSDEFLQSIMDDHKDNINIITNHENDVSPAMGPEEVVNILDYILNLDLQNI